MPTTTAQAQAEFEAQPRLQPGEAGWWKVWGASVRDIRAGDLVLYKRDGVVTFAYIQETYESPAAPLRFGFVEDGVRFSLGALVPVVVVRPGTKNTLA